MRSANSGHLRASVNLVAGGYEVYRGPATLYFFTKSRSTVNLLITILNKITHRLDQACDILELCVGRHAVAQVKYMPGAPRHLAQNPRGFKGDRLWRCAQQERVQVALHSQAARQTRANFGQPNIPIYTQNLRAGSDQVWPIPMHPFGEHNYRHLPFERIHDLFDPDPRSCIKKAIGQK